MNAQHMSTAGPQHPHAAMHPQLQLQQLQLPAAVPPHLHYQQRPQMSSPSLFDAFAPLGGKPSNGSSAATSAMNHPNRGIPLSTLAAASVQAAAAAQPGQPYDEKAALDSLTAQLAGTSLKSQGQQNVGASMWPRRSGIVKFFNSTKGMFPYDGELLLLYVRRLTRSAWQVSASSGTTPRARSATLTSLCTGQPFKVTHLLKAWARAN